MKIILITFLMMSLQGCIVQIYQIQHHHKKLVECQQSSPEFYKLDQS